MTTTAQHESIMDHWTGLLDAAGLWDIRYTPEDVYEIVTVLLRDAELGRAHAKAVLAQPGDYNKAATRADALATWTADQKAALKARVVAKLGARKE